MKFIIAFIFFFSAILASAAAPELARYMKCAQATLKVLGNAKTYPKNATGSELYALDTSSESSPLLSLKNVGDSQIIYIYSKDMAYSADLSTVKDKVYKFSLQNPVTHATHCLTYDKFYLMRDILSENRILEKGQTCGDGYTVIEQLKESLDGNSLRNLNKRIDNNIQDLSTRLKTAAPSAVSALCKQLESMQTEDCSALWDHMNDNNLVFSKFDDLRRDLDALSQLQREKCYASPTAPTEKSSATGTRP